SMSEVWELNTMERRYSVPPSTISEPHRHTHGPSRQQNHTNGGSEIVHSMPGHMPQTAPAGPNMLLDLHAWSIYRQNLNSDFTDSALGSQEKAPPPFGNFQLRESTVQSILNNP
ncbi:unnamed protein product, partial [Meganyctiphanes norvegica]